MSEIEERAKHGMNCAYRGNNEEACTCGYELRSALGTEQEMHKAWRKRAEEAEKESAGLRAQLAAAEKRATEAERYLRMACALVCEIDLGTESPSLEQLRAVLSPELGDMYLAIEANKNEKDAAAQAVAEVLERLNALRCNDGKLRGAMMDGPELDQLNAALAKLDAARGKETT